MIEFLSLPPPHLSSQIKASPPPPLPPDSLPNRGPLFPRIKAWSPCRRRESGRRACSLPRSAWPPAAPFATLLDSASVVNVRAARGARGGKVTGSIGGARAGRGTLAGCQHSLTHTTTLQSKAGKQAHRSSIKFLSLLLLLQPPSATRASTIPRPPPTLKPPPPPPPPPAASLPSNLPVPPLQLASGAGPSLEGRKLSEFKVN